MKCAWLIVRLRGRRYAFIVGNRLQRKCAASNFYALSYQHLLRMQPQIECTGIPINRQESIASMTYPVGVVKGERVVVEWANWRSIERHRAASAETMPWTLRTDARL